MVCRDISSCTSQLFLTGNLAQYRNIQIVIYAGKYGLITEKYHFWIWPLLVTLWGYCISQQDHSWWMVQNLSRLRHLLCFGLTPHSYSALWDLVNEGQILAWWCWLRYCGPERQIHSQVYFCWNKLYAFLRYLSYFPIALVKHPKEAIEGRKSLIWLVFWEDMDYLHREAVMGSWWLVAVEARAWSYLLSCWWIKKERDWGQVGWPITPKWSTFSS